MYCNNCGKEVLGSDKFCPFCGSLIKKRIQIDGNVTPESLKKRAFIMLEDGNFSDAEEYFDNLLDMAPDDAENHLGKLMVTTKCHSISELIDYYKNLYNGEDYKIEKVDLGEAFSNHVNESANKYRVDNYLSEENIRNIYYNDDFYCYKSILKTREQQKEIINNLFNNDRLISRIKSFSNKEINKYFDSILKEYDKRIKEAKDYDLQCTKKINDNYSENIDRIDNKIKELHEKAINNRERDYQTYINCFEKSNNAFELEELSNKFLKLNNYKESKEYIDKCHEKINQLNAQQIKKRKTLITRVSLATAFIIGMILLYFFVLLPNSRYKNAISLYENGNYKDASIIFRDLNQFKDSKEMYIDSLYKEGNELLNSGDYKNAITIFDELGTYKDSLDKLYESKYSLGKQMMKQDSFDSAIDVFKTISEYKDSKELINKSLYSKAILLRVSQQYDESISIFKQLGEFEDSIAQLQQTERDKAANSVKIPSIKGKKLNDALAILKKYNLDSSVKEETTKNMRVGTIISVFPDEGTVVLKGSSVSLVVAKGSSQYSNYSGNGDTKALFQIGVNNGMKVNIRSTPTTTDDNEIGYATSLSVYNVYETLNNDGYIWYRIDVGQWIAYDSSWITQDSERNRVNGSFNIYKARINSLDDDHIGVYKKPVDDSYAREWVGSVNNGDIVTVYYSFYSGSRYWYKIGINQWVRDSGGDRIVPVY